MRHAIAAVAIALVACAQSPHVYRPELLDTWDGVPKSLGGGLNSSGRSLFHIKPLLTDPSTKQQEGRIPPSFPYPECFFCPKNVDTARDELNEFRRFTTERFIELRRPGNYEVELRDKCVFYTRNTTHRSGLSRGSTELACMYDKYSIWVSPRSLALTPLTGRGTLTSHQSTSGQTPETNTTPGTMTRTDVSPTSTVYFSKAAPSITSPRSTTSRPET